jgi:hypothetical protein
LTGQGCASTTLDALAAGATDLGAQKPTATGKPLTSSAFDPRGDPLVKTAR